MKYEETKQIFHVIFNFKIPRYINIESVPIFLHFLQEVNEPYFVHQINLTKVSSVG